jgi:hypothetical protein
MTRSCENCLGLGRKKERNEERQKEKEKMI